MKTSLAQVNHDRRFLVFPRRFSHIPHRSSFMEGEIRLAGKDSTEGICAVAGWGHKPTADRARRYAAAHDLPYIAVEDGFLRSLCLGCESAAPLSLVVDSYRHLL